MNRTIGRRSVAAGLTAALAAGSLAITAGASAASTPLFHDDFTGGLASWRPIGAVQAWTPGSAAGDSWIQVSNESASSGSYLTVDPTLDLGDGYEVSVQVRVDQLASPSGSLTAGNVSLITQVPTTATSITAGGPAIQIRGTGSITVMEPVNVLQCSGSAPVVLGEVTTLTAQRWGDLIRYLVNGQQVAVRGQAASGGMLALGAYRATARVTDVVATALDVAPAGFPSAATGCAWTPADPGPEPGTSWSDDFAGGLAGWRYVGATQAWSAASDADNTWVQVSNLTTSSGSYLTPDPAVDLGDSYEYSVQARVDAVGTEATVSVVAGLPAGATAIGQGGTGIQVRGAGSIRIQSPVGTAVCSGQAPLGLGELVTLTVQRWGTLMRFLVNDEQVAVVTSASGGGTPAFGAYRATARVYSAAVTPLDEAPAGFPTSATGCSWSEPDPSAGQPVLVNQSGYDLEGPKRFTAPLAEDGAAFAVLDPADEVVASGVVQAGVGDFTDFAPGGEGPFRVQVTGVAGTGVSYPFGIGPSWTTRVASVKALDFLAGSMCHNGDFAAAAANTPVNDVNGATWCQKAVGWRDASQYAYELTVLADLLASNPSVVLQVPGRPGLLTGMPYTLPADTPLVAQLLYWGAEVYLLHGVNEPQLTTQLASFARVYPLVEEWLPADTYDRVTAHLRATWADPARDRFSWQAYTPYDGNLLDVYTQVGTGKGELAPGFSIIGNLDLYTSAVRDGWPEAQTYLDAAVAQAEWIASGLDVEDPATTKGQRMSEWLTVTAMVRLAVEQPAAAPQAAVDFVGRWADTMIDRSDNMWDFRKYDDSGTAADRWTIPTFTGGSADDPNEVGNTAGFAAPALAAAMLLGPDDPRSTRLEQLAQSHVDNVFGRNPVNRAAQYRIGTPALAYEGLDRGWFSEYQGGAGLLQGLPGVLDGGPKNGHYPYAPTVGNIGHTEGWVNFNTAFVEALAWLGAARTTVAVVGPDPAAEPVAGEPLTITVTGPFDLERRTDVVPTVEVGFGDGAPVTVPLTRSGPGVWTAELATTADQADRTVTARVGAGAFATTSTVTLAGPLPDHAPGVPVLQDDNGWDTGLRDADFTLTATLWWGVPGDFLRIREGDEVVLTQALTSQAMPQQASFLVTGKPNGTYAYRAELVNRRGATSSAVHTVTVSDASPGRPALSSDNWDGDGAYTVTANLWWGTNATRWELTEDGVTVASGSLTAATPRAQRVDVPLVARPLWRSP